jgi:pilus assembly protein CpaB
MAQKRYSLILVAALVVAAVATFVVYRALEAARAENRVVTQSLVVASEQIPEGASLSRENLRVEKWPIGTIPDSAWSSIDSAVGRVARVAIFEGEPIVAGRLAPPGTDPGLQVKITPGLRAMAVRIDDVAGLSGLIQPNSRVDVLVTMRPSQSEPNQVAKLFMSNMRVLAVGTVVTSGPDNRTINATTATLEVTPEEAERLALATREGTIQLVLRGFGDPDAIQTQGARSGDVLSQLRSAQAVRPAGATPAPAPRRRVATPPRAVVETVTVVQPPVVIEKLVQPAKPDSHQVQVFRGEKMTLQKFAKPDSTVRKPGVRPDTMSSR